MLIHHARRAASGTRRAALAGAAMLSVAALAGCTASSAEEGGRHGTPAADEGEGAAPQVRLTTNVGRRPVTVDTLVQVAAEDGALRRVRVTAGRTRLPGTLSDDASSWRATERLEPGTTYRVVAVAESADGQVRRWDRRFESEDLTLDQQTYPTVLPLDGDTVGVGMPVIVRFDLPVSDRAEIERHLSVDTSPVQAGSWHWVSDTEVHWRPRVYWKPGTEVSVDVDINGVDAGNGIYGQEDRTARFTVGDAVVMKVDVAEHHMRVFRNGELLRTIPISAGKPGFTTRSGIKVIVEKFRYKDMDAATTGISEDDAEYYNLSNVEYAQRVTYSGEFIHAAPWSVGSQGSANVSHGCVGMSTENAGWLFSLTKVGDVVDVVGSDRPMEPTNGYGDWNVPWHDYRTGSALH